MKVKDIIIYPIKSLGGIHLQNATCTEMGLQYDRRMMLGDADGQFISQREFPLLATVGARFNENGFTFFDKNNENNSVSIPHEVQLEKPGEVSVWKDSFLASRVKNHVSTWFSDFIDSKVWLYKMTSESSRLKTLLKSPGETKVSMADGYPYLFLSEGTLNDLNDKLDVSIPIDRFRANVILEEATTFEEEGLDQFEIGTVPFRMIKPCARCSMITINQKTAEKLVEPLKTLSLYKKQGNKVYFGMNAVSLKTGQIKVGDILAENN